MRPSSRRPTARPPGSALLTFNFDGRQAFDPRAQILGQHKGAAAAFDGTQGTGLDSFIKRRFAGARDYAGFGDRVGQRRIHLYLNNIEPVLAPATALALLRTIVILSVT